MSNSSWERAGRSAVVVAVVLLAGPPAFVEQSPEAASAQAGETCGTIAGIACAEGLWCDLRAGACAGRDLEGTCVRIHEVCSDNYAPVCGCDGKTYPNDCARILAKAQKDHAGECSQGRQGTLWGARRSTT